MGKQAENQQLKQTNRKVTQGTNNNAGQGGQPLPPVYIPAPPPPLYPTMK